MATKADLEKRIAELSHELNEVRHHYDVRYMGKHELLDKCIGTAMDMSEELRVLIDRLDTARMGLEDGTYSADDIDLLRRLEEADLI